MTAPATTGHPGIDELLPKYRELISDLRVKADRLVAEGTPESRMRARVLRCDATKAENLAGFLIDMCEIGLDEARAKWCPNGPIRRPAGWRPAP